MYLYFEVFLVDKGYFHNAATTSKTSNFTKWSKFSMKCTNAAMSGGEIVPWTLPGIIQFV